MEKIKINQGIENHFNKKLQKSGYPSKKTDAQELLSMVEYLECLRQNLQKEARCWAEGINEIESSLSIYQRAQFVLNTESRHLNLQQLDYLWGAIYETQINK